MSATKRPQYHPGRVMHYARPMTTTRLPPTYSLWQMTAYALKLGAIGFGGPVALVEYMHRDLVEDRRWLTQDDYEEGFALAQISPGPLAAQLAIYLGYCHYGVSGASLVGLAFVLPSFVMVVAFSVAYVAAGGSPILQAVFYTVGAAIIGLIARSAEKLTRKTVGKDFLLIGIWFVLALTTVITERESIPLILLAGLVTWLVKAPPRLQRPSGPTMSGLFALSFHTWVPLTQVAGPGASSATLWDIARFFATAGAFVFGSGLAIVPFLFGGLVEDLQWLTERQFLDAVAVALVTPGPVVITTAFIGYLVAGFPGAVVAAVATFLPCWFFTVVPAPLMRRYGQRPGIAAAVQGITTAAVGAISGAVIVLGRRSVIDPFTLALAVATYLVLRYGVRGRKIPEPAVVALSAVVGLAVVPFRT